MTESQHLNRREFLRAAIAGAGAALMPALAGSGLQRRPNIVFIIADDLGWADIGYHNTEVLTPNLDKLAAQSVRLQRHYVMPTCTPTRIGLMTGRYPSRLACSHRHTAMFSTGTRSPWPRPCETAATRPA